MVHLEAIRLVVLLSIATTTYVYTASFCLADAFHLTPQQQLHISNNKSGRIFAASSSSPSDSINKATGQQQQRKPWDILRFLRQSSRFMTIMPGSNPQKSSGTMKPGTVLWQAGNNNPFTFGPLDDVVMGGASASTFDQATGKWKGVVTDANNGGFVGIRSTPTLDYDLAPCQGIEWTIRVIQPTTATSMKKSLRLKIVVRDSTEFNGIGWSSSQDVTVSGSNCVIRVPFNKQVPTRFARTTPTGEEFNKSNVKSFQLVYSKFEYDGEMNPNFVLGDFDFQLVQLRTY